LTFSVSSVEGLGGLLLVMVAEGRLWVVHAGGPNETAISAVDPSTSRTLTTCRFGGYALLDLAKTGDVAVGSGTIWVALQGEDQVKRFDAATCELLDRIRLPEPTALVVDGQTLWVATADGQLRSVDIGTGAASVRTSTELVTRIRVGQGGLWLMTLDGKLLRLDRRTGRITAQVPGAFRAADLAVGAEGVWVYDQHQGAVLRIDPGTNRIVRAVPVISQPLVEPSPHVLALGAGAVWVDDKAGEAVVRVDRTADYSRPRTFARAPTSMGTRVGGGAPARAQSGSLRPLPVTVQTTRRPRSRRASRRPATEAAEAISTNRPSSRARRR
jgi:streptogramin lyase